MGFGILIWTALLAVVSTLCMETGQSFTIPDPLITGVDLVYTQAAQSCTGIAIVHAISHFVRTKPLPMYTKTILVFGYADLGAVLGRV